MSGPKVAPSIAVPPVTIRPEFLEPAKAACWLGWCQRRLRWRQERVRMFGREYDCRRLVAFAAEAGLRYRYSGTEHIGYGLPRPLSVLVKRVNLMLGTVFDSVLLTRYRSGNDQLGWHADGEPDLGPEPDLAVISLGVPRTLAFRTATKPRLAVRYRLEAGSLLHMGAGTQSVWQHSVPAERSSGERISLGFRQLRWP